jgi:SAM-dependent methyltransferase
VASGKDNVLNRPWVFRALRGTIDPGQEKKLRKVLADVPHSSVLELGCGLGTLSGMTDRPYTGLDFVPAYIEYAQEKFGGPTKRFVVGDVFDLPEDLGSTDVVALVNFIHHFDDEQVGRILKSLRTASPRLVMIVDVALERARWRFKRVFGPLDRGDHFRTTDAQAALLEKAGCTVERRDGYDTAPRIYPHSVLIAGYPA